MNIKYLWEKKSHLAALIDKIAAWINEHPKKAISIAVVITGLVAPQYQKTVDTIAQLLADQATPGSIEVQQSDTTKESPATP